MHSQGYRTVKHACDARLSLSTSCCITSVITRRVRPERLKRISQGCERKMPHAAVVRISECSYASNDLYEFRDWWGPPRQGIMVQSKIVRGFEEGSFLPRDGGVL